MFATVASRFPVARNARQKKKTPTWQYDDYALNSKWKFEFENGQVGQVEIWKWKKNDDYGLN